MSLSEMRDLDIVPIGDNSQKISVVQSHHKSKEKGKEEFFDNLWRATKNVLGIDKHEKPQPPPPPPPEPAPEPKKEEPKKEEPKKEEPKKEEPKPEPPPCKKEEPKPEPLVFPVSAGKRPMNTTSDSTPEKNETVTPVVPVPEAP